MKKIICRDSCELSHSADKIFEAVADVGTYNEWWGGVKVKVIENKTGFTGSKVEIKSNGGKFCCEITDIDQPRSVGVDYYKGVVRGKGTWIVENVSESSCLLHYNIDLIPYGFFSGLLSNFLDFSWMHSKTMKDMYKGLSLYLEKKK